METKADISGGAPATKPFLDPVLPSVRTRFQEWGEELAAAKVPTGGLTHLFEAVGRHQFIKIIASGVMPDSHVLDVGCGCLRAGYWLINFLQPGHYCGIEPNRKMLAAGIERLLSPEPLREKKPIFDHNDEFDFTVFNRKFDFILARSIWSHASLPQIERMLEQFKACSTPKATFLTSWVPAFAAKGEYTGTTFSWPAIRYLEKTIRDVVERAGLVPHVEEKVQHQKWLRITRS